jgi:Flagellar hook-length control protein FliK
MGTVKKTALPADKGLNPAAGNHQDMLLPELYSSHLALQPQVGGASVRAWTTGQILQATVVRQALDGSVTLRIGSQEIQARTGMSLAADQPLTLQVAQSGTQTVLRVLHVSDAQASPNPTTQQVGSNTPDNTLAQAWRQVLPREGDLQPLLAQLAGNHVGEDTAAAAKSATARTAGAENSLPAPIAAALRQFAAKLPRLESLFTTAGLKQAIRDSGIFLETRLAQSAQQREPALLGNDLKAGLLVLVSQLRAQDAAPPATTPPENATRSTVPTTLTADSSLATVARQADAALARIEHNQLASLTPAAERNPALIMELPVRHEAQHACLQLRVEQDQTRCTTANAILPWTVWLKFDLPQLGPVQARVTLSGDQVGTAIWAERETTAELFQQHLANLEAALRHAGLTPASLTSQTGAPPSPATFAPTTSLLDERA